jgi:hypothetical protein
MEKFNQLPKTEDCLAEGELVDLWCYRVERPSRSVSRDKREPQAGVASGLSNSASKAADASGDGVSVPEPNTETPEKVRAWRACRGLRAWRAPKQMHGTEEARRVPAALTTRAKQEGRRNDKKRCLALRESDRLIVSSGKAQPRNWRRGRRVGEAHTGNPCRKNDGSNGQTFL